MAISPFLVFRPAPLYAVGGPTHQIATPQHQQRLDEIITRDKISLDIIWLKSRADLDNLPGPDELAEEIVENLEIALEGFMVISAQLKKIGKLMMDIDAYSFEEHRHRYASWTAARAVQRSFAKTKLICAAIDAVKGLRAFVEDETMLSQQQYDQKHSAWCYQLMAAFNTLGKPCTFGRAVKIVAIYLKTAVVVPERGISERSLIIYPPIDRILLLAIYKHAGDEKLITYPWTQFDEVQFNEVKACIQKHMQHFNWKTEVAWRVRDQADKVE